VPGNVGLANSNRHLNLRPGISLNMGRANKMGGSDIELRHRDNGNSWFFILCTGTSDISADDTRFLLNFGWAKSSLSVLLSTPESLDVISSSSRPELLVPALIPDNRRHIPGNGFDSCFFFKLLHYLTQWLKLLNRIQNYKSKMRIFKQNVYDTDVSDNFTALLVMLLVYYLVLIIVFITLSVSSLS